MCYLEDVNNDCRDKDNECVCIVTLAMSGHGILKHFCPIKKGPHVDKNPPEDKELPDPSGPL